MSFPAWMTATITLFIVGCWRLATIPPVNSGPALTIGWACLFASAFCLIKAVPFDEDTE